MRQGLQVAGEPMKPFLLILTGLALALGAGACVRQGPRAPRAALEACRAPRALLAVRRAALQQAGEQGAAATLLERLKQDGRASLEDPEVQDYDRDTGQVTCTALLRLQPPGEGAQEISSNIVYEAAPLAGGRWRYRLTDPGQVVQAIASLGPLAPRPEPLPASSEAANAVAAAPAAPTDDVQTREDAAAAGDTGHSRRAAPAPAPTLAPATSPAPGPAAQ